MCGLDRGVRGFIQNIQRDALFLRENTMICQSTLFQAMNEKIEKTSNQNKRTGRNEWESLQGNTIWKGSDKFELFYICSLFSKIK